LFFFTYDDPSDIHTYIQGYNTNVGAKGTQLSGGYVHLKNSKW